jgi:phage gp29-like protein
MNPVMRLLGAAGRGLLRAAGMMTDQARPGMTGVRSTMTGHPAAGISPERLASILLEAEEGDAVRYLELAEDMEERDLHYLAVLGTRRRSVSQLDVGVDPASSDNPAHQAHADMIARWLDRDVLQGELFDMLDAIGKGFSATQVLWDTKGGAWLPRELLWTDPRWFEIDRNDGRTLRLRNDTGGADALASRKWIIHTHKAKSGLPIRGGLARVVCWAWMFKNFTVKDWVTFLEVYGQPLRLGRYGPEASEEDRDVLFQAVMNIASDCGAIIPKSMELEFIKAEGQQANAAMFQGAADWWDRQVSKAVLGQTTTTDAVSGGHAVAQEHRQVQEDIERADAKQLASTLNETVVKWIIDLNFGPQDAYPRIRIGRPEVKDAKLVVDAVKALVPMGLEVDMGEVRSIIGLRAPAAGAVLLKAPVSLNSASPSEAVTATVAPMVDQLGKEADGTVAATLAAVKKEFMAASSAADFHDRLARLRPVLERHVTTLAPIMGDAFAAAHLAGRFAVISEGKEHGDT